jgi:serine phosphatase RsbU (regulator of sigma subunit)
LTDVIEASRALPAKGIVDAIFTAVQDFRGEAQPNDDMTAVAVKITA